MPLDCRHAGGCDHLYSGIIAPVHVTGIKSPRYRGIYRPLPDPLASETSHQTHFDFFIVSPQQLFFGIIRLPL